MQTHLVVHFLQHNNILLDDMTDMIITFTAQEAKDTFEKYFYSESRNVFGHVSSMNRTDIQHRLDLRPRELLLSRISTCREGSIGFYVDI